MQDMQLQQLKAILTEENIRLQEPMNRHTSFRIGGPCDVFCTPKSVESLKELVNYFKKEQIPYFLLGKGSNLLVNDKGFRGAVIQLGDDFRSISVEGTTVRAGAAESLAALAKHCLEHSLTGLEFAAGIPGSLGGAMVMNAGAYGGEMADVTRQVTVLDEEGDVITLSNSELKFGYRHSLFRERRLICLEVTLELTPGDREQIAATMRELAERRREKQPLEYPSAGSTFKRPAEGFAGKYIMDAGLRGYRVGGAQISEKHCGFVINRGDATAQEVREVMRHAQQEVSRQFGVGLEPEVLFLGWDE